MRPATIVVFGILGRSPYAGVGWQGLHYLEGFRRLGHEVWYVEDTGDWPFDLEQNTVTEDPGYTLRFLERTLTWAGFADRWAYRAASRGGEVYGPAGPMLESLLARADALVNLTGVPGLAHPSLHVRRECRVGRMLGPRRRLPLSADAAAGGRRLVERRRRLAGW